MQVIRCSKYFFKFPHLPCTSNLHKHLVNILSQRRVARQQTVIGIGTRRACMIITRAHMGIADQVVCLAAYNQHHLGMGFIANHAIDHLTSGQVQFVG